MSLFHTKDDTHRECWELLPWFANERASTDDARRMEIHLRACSLCRQELAIQRRLRETIRTSEAPVVLAPQASWQKLVARMDSTERTSDQSTEHPLRRGRKPMLSPRWLALAACMQAVVLIAAFGVTWWESRELLAPRFSTLTTPASVPQGPVIRIVFREHVTVAELNELLRSLDAHIVAGPSSAHVYTVQLANARRTNEQTEQVAARLREDPRVSFSEPAVAELAGK